MRGVLRQRAVPERFGGRSGSKVSMKRAGKLSSGAAQACAVRVRTQACAAAPHDNAPAANARSS